MAKAYLGADTAKSRFCPHSRLPRQNDWVLMLLFFCWISGMGFNHSMPRSFNYYLLSYSVLQSSKSALDGQRACENITARCLHCPRVGASKG